MSDIETKQAIRDMYHRYCRGLDRMDKAVALSVFHPDSHVEVDGAFSGTGPEFVDWVWIQHAGAARHLHNITNLYVEPAGDTASSEAYVIMNMRIERPEGVTVITTNGRYADQWVRHDGRWVIVKRLAIQEFQEFRQLGHDGVPADKTSARRDTSDPTYALTPPLNLS